MTSNEHLYSGKEKKSMGKGLTTIYPKETRDAQTRQKKPRVNREVIPQSNDSIMTSNSNSSQQPPLNTYANIDNGSKNSSSFNVRFVTSQNNQNDDNTVEIPIDVVRKGSIPFEHTLYGFFIGEKAPFNVVNEFAHDTWKDDGILDVFTNDRGLFFFKFDNEQSMIKVIENSPWMIWNMPIFIRRWEPGLRLEKLHHDMVPIWVKLYDLPLELWTGDGLSYLASKLGVPIAVDTSTARMCENPAGCMAYARILIELSAETAWKEEVRVIIPKLNGHDKSVSTVRVEYAWLPPCCSACKIFGHANASCPHHSNSNTQPHDSTSPYGVPHGKCNVDDEGFTAVSRKGGKNVKAASEDATCSTATLNEPMPKTINGQLAHINPSSSIDERVIRRAFEALRKGSVLSQNLLINSPEKMSGVDVDEDKNPSTCDEGARIKLKVQGQDGNMVIFTMKKNTQLLKLMNAYCQQQSVVLGKCSFAYMYKGRRLRAEWTPHEVGMMEGDELQAMLHQTGC